MTINQTKMREVSDSLTKIIPLNPTALELRTFREVKVGESHYINEYRRAIPFRDIVSSPTKRDSVSLEYVSGTRADRSSQQTWEQILGELDLPESSEGFAHLPLPVKENSAEQDLFRRLQAAVGIYEKEYGEEKPLNEADHSSWQKWEQTLSKQDFPESLKEFMHFFLPVEENSAEWDLLHRLQTAVRIYEREYGEEKPLNEAAMLASLKQVLRYFPELVKHDGEVFIDYDTNFFGITYKQTRLGRGTLNLLIQDNNEIMFSYAHKVKRIGVISGTARLTKEVENYADIRKLFQLMD